MEPHSSRAALTRPIFSDDFEYLSEGYYACLEAEAAGHRPVPTVADTLDAHVVPLALERVRMAGLPVPAWTLSNEAFTPPAVLYGVNPFARNHVVVGPDDDVRAAARRVSRRGKFVICCQSLPPEATLVEFDLVFGQTPTARYAAWAEALHRLFGIPIGRVRLIESPSGTFFSAFERVSLRHLSADGRALLASAWEPSRRTRG